MSKIRVAVIGAGARGMSFGESLRRDDMELVAVVDLNPVRIETFKKRFKFENVIATSDYHDILDKIDAAIVTTPDYAHTDIVVDLLNSGKSVFCEKPMATTTKDCQKMIYAQKQTGGILCIGFVLRFTWYFRQVKQILDSGIIGKVQTISQKEILHYKHAGSYYRRWHRKKDNSGDLIMTKSCHDLDLMNWFAESRPTAVSAFASRKYFTPDKKGADFCSQCSKKDKCLFVYTSGNPLYSDDENKNPTQYGLDMCVFNEDSDINDSYNAIIRYENGIQASYELVPLSNKKGRTVYIVGDKGDLYGDMHDNTISVSIYSDGSTIEYKAKDNDMGNHGGGDPIILDSFIKAIKGEQVQAASGEDGMYSTALAEAMRVSSEKRKIVNIAELFDPNM